jgi:hypothetical protein
MITQHGEGVTRLHHIADDSNRFDLLGPNVDEVTHEDRLSFGMPPNAIVLSIVHLRQELLQHSGIAVKIANDVVKRCHGI